jgi:hypothetical protein
MEGTWRSLGSLRYSPKKYKAKEEQNWWVVLDCDPDIGKYYRHLYHLSSHRCRRLWRPAWAEHVTVLRNEEPPEPFKPLWERYAGETVEFTVSPVLRTNGEFCWLDVTCDFLLDLRVELGLAREPEYPLHLTVGHTNERWVDGG